ncbi:MAG TPA: hypothetical protein VHM67_13185 [Gemmatimonadaceae bacterium]|nr:hypothetical protein [Gemmatimonadaceae bacterium]
MRALRVTASLLVLFATAAARPDGAVRKEHVRLQLSTESGAAGRARIVTRGLIIIAPTPTTGRQPWQVVRTMDVPGELLLAGIGEADVRLVDSTATLVANVVQIRRDPPPAQRLSGRGLRVSRSAYTEPYTIVPLGDARVSDRR